MIVLLSRDVQKFVAIWWPATELLQGEFSIKSSITETIVSEMGPWTEWSRLSCGNAHMQIKKKRFEVSKCIDIEVWSYVPNSQKAALVSLTIWRGTDDRP